MPLRPEPAAPVPMKPRSKLTWSGFATLLTVAAFSYGLALYFADPSSALSIGPADPAFENQPYSVPFELRNENRLFPIAGVRFFCDVPMISRTDGAKDYNLRFRPSQLKPIWMAGGEVKTAHCENSVYFGGRTPDFGDLEFGLTVTFRPFPYIWERTSRRKFIAVIDPVTHKFGRWTAN